MFRRLSVQTLLTSLFLIVILTAALVQGADIGAPSATADSPEWRADYPLESAVLATSCKRLNILSNGELGASEPDASLDYIDDCDTFNSNTDVSTYLYDGGLLVGRIEGADTLLFRTYLNSPSDADGFRPLSALEVDSTTYPDYTYSRSECVTADSSIGCIIECFVPKALDTCESIVQVLKFYNATGAPLSGVYLGGFYDWNVPSDSGLRNGSGFDITRKLVYQYGAEYNQDDSVEALCGQESSDRFAGVMNLSRSWARNAMTIDNATYVYQTGPFGTDAPLPAGVVYSRLFSKFGYEIYQSSDPDSQFVDLSTLVTYGSYYLFVGDTIVQAQILSTGRDGQADFFAEFDKAKVWAVGNLPYDYHCCVVPGDANYDGTMDVGDPVFIINYCFRGGPPPPCLNAADANNDCQVNLGDAVFLISRIFRFGPAPVCGCVDNL